MNEVNVAEIALLVKNEIIGGFKITLWLMLYVCLLIDTFVKMKYHVVQILKFDHRDVNQFSL